LAGRPTAFYAPNFRFLSETWRNLLAVCRPVISTKNETERRIELISGGSIDCYSLDSSDAGRGRAFACVVIDEAAIVPDLKAAWQETIRPCLTDYRGDAWILSTPKGIAGGSAGYFHSLFQRGVEPEHSEWRSWCMPTSANPVIDPSEIEAARHDLTELAFDQEYLARFVSWEGSVFRAILAAVWEVPTALRGAMRPTPFTTWLPTYAIGVDWGRTNDYTVFTVACNGPYNQQHPESNPTYIVEIDRFRGVEYAVARARLEGLYRRYGCPVVLAESNAMGGPVIEQLSRDGMRVRPFATTNQTKAQIIDSLALAFERGEIRIPNDSILIGELQSFESRILPSGLVQCSAPDGGHDDTVISLALANWALKRYAGAFSMDPQQLEARREFGLRLHLGGFRSLY
jgi:hypothetical protein